MNQPNKPDGDKGAWLVLLTVVVIGAYLLTQAKHPEPVILPEPAPQPTPVKPPKRPKKCPLCHDYHVTPTPDCPQEGVFDESAD